MAVDGLQNKNLKSLATYNGFCYLVPIYVSGCFPTFQTVHLRTLDFVKKKKKKRVILKFYFKHLKSQDFHNGHVGENNFFHFLKKDGSRALFISQHSEQTTSDSRTDTPHRHSLWCSSTKHRSPGENCCCF